MRSKDLHPNLGTCDLNSIQNPDSIESSTKDLSFPLHEITIHPIAPIGEGAEMR